MLLFRLWLDSCSLVTFMGLVLILTAGGLAIYELERQKAFPAPAQATIILLWDVHGGPRGINEHYVKYQYSVPEAKEQVFVQTDVISPERYAALSQGQSIAIRYDPQHPEASRLDQFNERTRVLVRLFFVVGMVLVIADPIFTAWR